MCLLIPDVGRGSMSCITIEIFPSQHTPGEGKGLGRQMDCMLACGTLVFVVQEQPRYIEKWQARWDFQNTCGTQLFRVTNKSKMFEKIYLRKKKSYG
jgi:hypothetical protein